MRPVKFYEKSAWVVQFASWFALVFVLAAQHKDGEVGIAIRICGDFFSCFSVERDAPLDVYFLVAAKIFKILDGQKPDVGRVKPFIL